MTDPTTPTVAEDVTRGLATLAALMPDGTRLDRLAMHAHGLRHGLTRPARYGLMSADYRRALLTEVETRLAEEEPAAGPVWTLDADGSLDTWTRIPDPDDDPARHWRQDGDTDVHETWLALTEIGVVTPDSF